MKRALVLIILLVLLFQISLTFAAPRGGGPVETIGPPSCSSKGGTSCQGEVSVECKCGSATAAKGDYCCAQASTAGSKDDCYANCGLGGGRRDVGLGDRAPVGLGGGGTDGGTPAGAITEAITGVSSPLEIVSNWQGLAILAIIISIILIAIAYAIGIGFSMPEMQAWASTELVQVFSTVLIVIFLLGIATFIDLLVTGIVNGSEVGNLHCDIGVDNCLNKTSQRYLQDYIDMGKDQARSVLEDNVVAAGWMNKRLGIGFARLLWMFQLSFTTTFGGQFMLDFDRLGIVFMQYQNLLSSLEAQKFFLSEISFKIGPILLAIGIVMRSFFLTRKLGGLLIAISAGIMIFFPAMYIFDWATLDLAASGDYNGVLDLSCPSECSKSPPIAYYGDTQINNITALYEMFDESRYDEVRNLSLGRIDSLATSSGETIYSCDYNTVCDRACRELPYPSTNTNCMNTTTKMQEECAKLPAQCKVVREIQITDEAESNKCPEECRTVPPLKSDCRNESCLDSKYDCRVAKLNDLSWRPKMPDAMKGKKKCDQAKDCQASTNAYESCTYVIPQLGFCDDICIGCPAHCRLDQYPETGLPGDCYKDDGTTILDACTSCPGTCKAKVSGLDTTLCSGCPSFMRLSGNDLGPEYSTAPCGQDTCPLNSTYRAKIPESACQECLYSDEVYEYNPPMNLGCADQCKPTGGTPSKSSGDYTKIDESGLVGRTEIREVAKLMVPAYLLPLINIAATLILIRSLSGILGGDIEIPGIARIF